MDFTEYQEEAYKTATYPGSGTIQGLTYVILGLNGEAGELAEKLKKIIRDRNGELTAEDIKLFVLEGGDIQWYLAMLCKELDCLLDDMAQANLDKLASRQKRGVLSGSGDTR
jgi:NTP pyrophosphatase (non-canonical NTP hydrolase)